MKKIITISTKGLDIICQFLCVVSLILLIATTNIAVFFRYVLRSPLTWSNELATYLLLSFTFWGATMGLIRESFFSLDTFVELLPKKIRWLLSIASKILILIFLLVAILYTRPLIQQAKLTGTLSPAMGIPMRLIYLFLLTGFLFMFMGNIFSLAKTLFMPLEKETKTREKEGER
ncbi:TRAP transporter small permease subunit [Candidatus Aerophobetes bacterium]|nr:TRAP transporter small permease subunit [Candidatus Aerophobetes bacterium]